MVRASTREDKVAEFHKAMGLAVNYEAHSQLLDLRRRLIAEEAREVDEVLEDMLIECTYAKPISDRTWEHFLKELCDLQYVLSGTIVSLRRLNAVDFDVAFNRVHASNMSKLDENGEPIKNEFGKVIKGPNYKEPDLKDCV